MYIYTHTYTYVVSSVRHTPNCFKAGVSRPCKKARN